MRLPSVVPLVAGTALVVACDGAGPSNLAPTVAFSVWCDHLDCTSSNGSADPDGTIAAYDWDFGDSSAHLTTRLAAHRYVAPGRFTVTLRVADDRGATASANTEVNVSAAPANIAPVAAFTAACTKLACEFTNQSFDGNAGGALASYAWYFGDNSAAVTTRDAAHTYAAGGEFMVTLTVTDDDGATATVTEPVEVREPHSGPFPPVPASALTFNRVNEHTIPSGARSRYVLYEDSTFALQYLIDSGFFEFTGRYSRVNQGLDFEFDGSNSAGPWQAIGIMRGDSLVITYNLLMQLDDFENGVYVLAPTPLAFTYDDHIHVVSTDGSRLRQVTSGDREDAEAAWSPDGRRIALTQLDCSRSAAAWSCPLPTHVEVLRLSDGQVTRLTEGFAPR